MHAQQALIAAAALVSTAASASASAASETRGGAFDPVSFFTGQTVGRGTLRQVLKSQRSTESHSTGTVRDDGTLVLDQTVAIGTDPVKTRRWQLKETSPGHWRGTLSDASGPVQADLEGASLHITYSMKGGLIVDQMLTLEPGGQAARNVMKIHRFGMTFASLDETIHRVRPH